MMRPRRADVLGAVFILAVALLTFGLTAVMIHAPLVALSLVAVVLVVYAGHVIGDELEAKVREWTMGRTEPAGDPRPDPAGPVFYSQGDDTAVESQGPTACVCGEPDAPNVIHRTGAPCFMAPDERRAARLRHPSNWRNRV